MALFNGLASVTFLSFLNTGQAVSNTFHISDQGAGAPPSLADMTTLATDIATWFDSTYKVLLDTDAILSTITVRQVSDPTAPVVVEEYVNAVSLAGTTTPASPRAPQSACALIALKTPNASRRFRGHMFLPPFLAPAAFNGDQWLTSSGLYIAAQAVATKFQAGCGPTPTWTGTLLPSYTLSIYSKTAALASEPSVAICSSVVLDRKVHWLRSRERGAS